MNVHTTSTRPLRPTRGFTFVEILAAMLFMAIVIPAIIEGLTTANRAGVMASRRRIGAQLADKQLNEIVITQQWMMGNTAGDFGEDYPGYRWTMTSESWIESPLRQISVEVWFKVQEEECSVILSTLVDEEEAGQTSTETTDETAESTAQ